MNSVEQKDCSGCGNSFTCGAQEREERCWCDALPHLPSTAIGGRDCFCPKCLRDVIQGVALSQAQAEEDPGSAKTAKLDPQQLLVEGED
jgi:hypothetical protein